MSFRAVRHELSDQSFVGTPRPLPRLLFCHVPDRWCGRKWWVTNESEYALALKAREVHQELCVTVKRGVVHGWTE